MFRHAILRQPSRNFAEGLTTASLSLGRPDFVKVMQQYECYCDALARCGLSLTVLDADPAHPDSTFVEDTAVLSAKTAVLTRPGVASRAAEVASIREPLARFFSSFAEITAPGTLDGGDICHAGQHFFIGISQRTNEHGGKQLAAILAAEGYTSSFVDIRGMKKILHLKSGIAYLENDELVVIEEMATRQEFSAYHLIRVEEKESYAANCVRVNDHVLIAAGYPLLEARLKERGYSVIPLEVSEFQKMDGGLSCLSLRF